MKSVAYCYTAGQYGSGIEPQWMLGQTEFKNSGSVEWTRSVLPNANAQSRVKVVFSLPIDNVIIEVNPQPHIKPLAGKHHVVLINVERDGARKASDFLHLAFATEEAQRTFIGGVQARCLETHATLLDRTLVLAEDRAK
jgi:hypothetical protein